MVFLKLTETNPRLECDWVLETIAASFPNLHTLHVPARAYLWVKVVETNSNRDGRVLLSCV